MTRHTNNTGAATQAVTVFRRRYLLTNSLNSRECPCGYIIYDQNGDMSFRAVNNTPEFSGKSNPFIYIKS